MLPAELAREVKRIQFVTGRQVANVMAGAYLSVFKGRGMEFDEVRPYVPGDDVRTIDWNVTARTGEPHVKRYVEERELTVMLLCDVSHSQDFGSGHRSKLEAAVELCALLALSAVESGDKVGLLLFHGGADVYIPPRGASFMKFSFDFPEPAVAFGDHRFSFLIFEVIIARFTPLR